MHAQRWRLLFFTVLLIPALPLALVAVAHRLWIRRKGLVGLRDKLTGAGPAVKPGQIMIHGVSLGEVNLMRPLVPKLESAFATRCLLTTTTETGRQQLDANFADHERAFLPLDLPWATWRFLARTRPRLVILLELEVWPIFLCTCFARGIPVMLVNARVSSRSHRGYRRAGALLRPLFGALTLALSQNATWGARLLSLGVRRERLVVSGSMKADMVQRATPQAMASEAERLGLIAGKPVLLLASTSSDGRGTAEEQVVLNNSLQFWHERGWQIIICPRHPERGDDIAHILAEMGASTSRSSRGDSVRAHADPVILIVDEIGKLAALYAWTASVNGIAVVGGSLGSGRGGQNMLEASAHGCCTVVGPDTRNFPDAVALLRNVDGIVETQMNTVVAVLTALADQPERRSRIGAAGQRAWLYGLGATERVVTAIANAFASITPR